MQYTAHDTFGGGYDYDHPNYYAILGCDRCSTKSQIIAEYRQRIRQLHPDKSLKQVPEIFHELHKAKNILIDDETRRMYDAWFDCSINIPWRMWLENSHNFFGVHWTSRVHSLPALKYRKGETKMEDSFVGGILCQPSSHHSLLLNKFRHYEN
ncbi:DnaJ domain family protein [Brugia pahangi]|uniref:J domain-containing protein n=1 Tax=Brugia pahangi TaxID=6280 RepID=A0A0N4SZ34_BRUPA|nr:unnamed protein product [Brugia pahangi]